MKDCSSFEGEKKKKKKVFNDISFLQKYFDFPVQKIIKVKQKNSGVLIKSVAINIKKLKTYPCIQSLNLFNSKI